MNRWCVFFLQLANLYWRKKRRARPPGQVVCDTSLFQMLTLFDFVTNLGWLGRDEILPNLIYVAPVGICHGPTVITCGWASNHRKMHPLPFLGMQLPTKGYVNPFSSLNSLSNDLDGDPWSFPMCYITRMKRGRSTVLAVSQWDNVVKREERARKKINPDYLPSIRSDASIIIDNVQGVHPSPWILKSESDPQLVNINTPPHSRCDHVKIKRKNEKKSREFIES